MTTNPFSSFSTAALFAAGALCLTSCGEKKEEQPKGAESTPGATGSSSDPLFAEVFLAEKPADATPVTKLRKSAKAGDEVVVSGKIGGAMKPFTEGFAAFVLADTALKTCDLIPEDMCETPWDACCADPDVIKASRLTVQIVDDEMFPVEKNLRMVEGLSELDELVVTGKVAEGSTEENMIINATGIFLAKEWVAPKREKSEEG